MKKVVLLGAVVLGLAACTQNAPEEKAKQVALDTDAAKFSYSIGMDVGASLRQLGADVDADVVVEALRTSLTGGELRMKAEEAGQIKQAFFQKRQQEKQAEMAASGAENKAAGEAFLAANGQKDGVTVTASGLQYEVLTATTGTKPTESDTVKVHYKGTLIDGTEFDSSYARGEPATFPLSGVIAGWTEGVQLMNVGSKYHFVVPSDLAYGAHGAGQKIGPNATLLFDIELLSIEPAAAVAK